MELNKMELQELVELLIKISNYGTDPNFKIPTDTEDYISEESGLLRDWDHITEKYTETPSDYLFRIYDFFEYNIFETE